MYVIFGMEGVFDSSVDLESVAGMATRAISRYYGKTGVLDVDIPSLTPEETELLSKIRDYHLPDVYVLKGLFGDRRLRLLIADGFMIVGLEDENSNRC